MEDFQEAAARQARLLTARLNEALRSGLRLLHSELGVEEPEELLPPWALLVAACVGLVLLVALWASACRWLFGRRRGVDVKADRGLGVKTTGKAAEDQKTKKKKKAEKV